MTTRLIASVLLLIGTSIAGAQSARGTVVGRVTEARSGLPLGQAVIEVAGTRLATGTTEDGRFRLTNVPAGAQTIVARRIGYGAVRRPVTVAEGRETTVDFTLEPAAISLDEVVVTGTAGGEQRRAVGNAVATIDATDVLAKSAAPNITSLLNARAPGLSIQTTTGRLGAVPAIQIRGRSSLSLANNPLIYLDGVRINSASGTGPVAVSGGLAGQGSQVGGRLNDLNPDDIESIEVISGPAAATIYGTEAASGVIQIITKKGRAGSPPQLGLRVEEGSLVFRDAAGRVQTNYAKDKAGNVVTWNGVQQEADSGRPLYRTGLTRHYDGSVSGGQDQARYYVAAGYQNDYGVEPNNYLRQATLHANLNNTLGSRTEIATNLNYSFLSAHLGADIGASALLGAQVGHIVLNPGSRGFYPGFPPEVPQQLYDNADGINRFTGSGTLTNRPTDWFSQRAIVGLDYTGEDARAIEKFAPPELASFLSTASASGRIGQTLRHNSMITADYSGTAKFNLTSLLSSSTSVGGQYYNTELNTSFLGGSGFPAPGVETVSSVTTPSGATQTQTINTTIGAYAQQQFGWRDRLFLTAAVRVDNNSAFGEDFKWVTYPKFGASWVVNEEPFWRWSSVVNTLRLRTAYGESGRQPNAFSALRTFVPISGANAVTPGTIGNPNLRPERGKEWEFGVETGLWNRLSLELTYFNKRTIDAILNQPVAPSSGFASSSPVNLGRVDNKGFELQGTLQAISRRNFGWDITGNIATNGDKIRDLGGLPSVVASAGAFNVVGYPIQGLWSKRVVSADRDANGFATNILCDGGAGKPGITCAQAPFVFLGTQTPATTGAVANTVRIGSRLRLYGLVDFKRGYLSFANVELLRCTGLLGQGLCRVNYFPQEFSVQRVAEANTAAYVGNYLDQYIQDGSFAKLRELSATYSIPERWLWHIPQANVSLAARDLHTWTNYRGLDPEALTTASADQAVTPPLTRFILTLNLKW